MSEPSSGGGGALPLRALIPNAITMLALCAGATAVRFAIDGAFDKAAAAGMHGLVGIVRGKRWLAAVALSTIIGHNWPVYLQFKGGKGVTTTYGSFLGLAWLPAAQTILIWVAVKKMTKTASIAALTSSACAPLFVIGFFHQPSRFQTGASALVFALIAAVLIYLRHIPNIQRLLVNEEMPPKKA